MFVGREAELKALEDLYGEDRFQFVPITGRRRVGKTRLIEEFIKDKPSVMFKAVPGSESMNLSLFNELVSGDSDPLRLDRILWRAEERSSGGRLIVVIDEYPNLVEDARHNSGLINNFIEAVKDTSRLFLILCGSSMSIMESEVMGKKSPLYGRRTGQIRLRPFDFETSLEMLKGFEIADAVVIYGLVGGIPYYLEQFDPGRSIEDNIRDRYLDPFGVIAGEPELMFLTEFRKPATYYAVIHAISKGRRTPSEIGQITGMKRDMVSHVLGRLVLLGFVEKDEPFGRGGTKDLHYIVKDRLLASYFRFVYPVQGNGSDSEVEAVFSYMSDNLNQYLGHVFEDICAEFVRKHGYSKVGRWWKGPVEIDIVASNDHSILFAECKYRNELTDADLIDDLMDKSKDIGTRGLDVGYALFSRSGFTRTAQMRAEAEGVRLYRLDELFDLDRRNDRRLSIIIGRVRARASMHSSMSETAFSKDCHCIAGRLMKSNTVSVEEPDRLRRGYAVLQAAFFDAVDPEHRCAPPAHGSAGHSSLKLRNHVAYMTPKF